MAVYGLRTATKEEIDDLKQRYPRGAHITHTLSGRKLNFNGVFHTVIGSRLRKWADLSGGVLTE